MYAAISQSSEICTTYCNVIHVYCADNLIERHHGIILIMWKLYNDNI